MMMNETEEYIHFLPHTKLRIVWAVQLHIKLTYTYQQRTLNQMLTFEYIFEFIFKAHEMYVIFWLCRVMHCDITNLKIDFIWYYWWKFWCYAIKRFWNPGTFLVDFSIIVLDIDIFFLLFFSRKMSKTSQLVLLLKYVDVKYFLVKIFSVRISSCAVLM